MSYDHLASVRAEAGRLVWADGASVLPEVDYVLADALTA